MSDETSVIAHILQVEEPVSVRQPPQRRAFGNQSFRRTPAAIEVPLSVDAAAGVLIHLYGAFVALAVGHGVGVDACTANAIITVSKSQIGIFCKCSQSLCGVEVIRRDNLHVRPQCASSTIKGCRQRPAVVIARTAILNREDRAEARNELGVNHVE